MNHLHPLRKLFFLVFCLCFCFLLTACSENRKEITRQCEKLIEQWEVTNKEIAYYNLTQSKNIGM